MTKYQLDYEQLDKDFPFSFHTITLNPCERLMGGNFRDEYLMSQRILETDDDESYTQNADYRRDNFDTFARFLPEVKEHFVHLERDVDFFTGIRRGYLDPTASAIHFIIAFKHEEDAIHFKLRFE